jgi:hypothetical protein
VCLLDVGSRHFAVAAAVAAAAVVEVMDYKVDGDTTLFIDGASLC